MEQYRPPVLYMRLKKKIYIKPGYTVTLGQVARLLAGDEALENELKRLVMFKHNKSDGNRVVIDLLLVVQTIRERMPDLSIEAYGDPQVLVMVSEKQVKPNIPILIGSWLLLFFGAGLAIMNFHTDVSMRDVHIRISELITGKRNDHPLWFQIPYSLGVGFGMALFFNHLFRKKFNEEPNPLEVELFSYQENLDAYVISDEMEKKSDNNLRQGADND